MVELKSLTEPQQRLLQQSCKEGGARKNSRARRPAEALKKAGLVTVDVEVQADALRGRHTLLYTVMATPAGRDLIASGAKASG